MNNIKKEFLDNYVHYGLINRRAVQKEQENLKSFTEELNMMHMVQKVMETERKVSLQLIGLAVVLGLTSFLFHAIFPSIILSVLGIHLVKKCIDYSSKYSKEEFLRLYPEHADLFHNSKKMIEQSIAKLNNNIKLTNEKIEILHQRYFKVMESKNILQNSSDDSFTKIEEMKQLIVRKTGNLLYTANCNASQVSEEMFQLQNELPAVQIFPYSSVKIEQLKKYRQLILQLKNLKGYRENQIYNIKCIHQHIKLKTLEDDKTIYHSNSHN